MNTLIRLALGLLFAAGLPATTALADEGGVPLLDLEELELRWGGKLQTDLRFQVLPKSAGVFYDRSDNTFYERDDIPSGLRRNENIFKLKLDAIYGLFAGVADIDFVWLGYPGEIEGISDLSLRDRVDPYYFEAHAAYLEACDFILDGMDLRIGQQLVQWGKADQFNPTNNLNANDLEDVLMFGQQMANAMVRLDYNPWSSIELAGVLVPIFKPALLPRSAALGLAMTDRLPFTDQSLRHRVHLEKSFAELDKDLFPNMRYPTVTSRVVPELPETSFENMQFAFRVAYTLFGQDLAISYYKGRHDIPQPISNHTAQDPQPFCNRANEEDCTAGLLSTVARVGYPEMQVVGFNLAGEIPLDWILSSLGGIGYRLEVGVYFPEEVHISLTNDDIQIGILQPAGEYDYDNDGEPGGPRPLVVESTPFAKWTLGLDYSFGSHVMMNLMWIHGMADEFGAGDFFHEGWLVRKGGARIANQEEFENCILFEGPGRCVPQYAPQYATEILRPRIGDYVALGVDVKFADDRALFRLFGLWDISGYYEDRWDADENARVRKYLSLFGDGFSAILFPEFNYNFGNGLELGFGALFQFGKNYTKFGDPAAGGSFVWTRARFSY